MKECYNRNELAKEYESSLKRMDSLMSKLKKVQNVLKDLDEEILTLFEIMKKIRDKNKVDLNYFEEVLGGCSSVYADFKDFEYSREKAHVKRCIEITETKLRRLRGSL